MKHLLILAIVALSFQINAQPKCVTGDCINGVGKLVTEEFTYQGTFLNSKIQKGKITFSDGSTLEGKFVEGKLEGYDCVQIESDGTTITGQFIAGEIVSGRVEDKLGNVQEGDFKNGSLYGKNCYAKNSDGTVLKGEFIDGKIVKGKITYSSSDKDRVSYEGTFSIKNEKVVPHGTGTMLLKNGNKLGPNWVYGDFIRNGEVKPEIPSGKFAIGLSKNGGVYELVGVITNGQHVLSKDFILDTGASVVVLPWSTVVELQQQNIISNSDFYEGSVSLTTASGDIMEGKKFRIRQINFEFKTPEGKVEIISLKNVEAVVNSSESERRKSIYGLSVAPPLLGQSALQQLKKFELDYEQNLLLINNP
jgi:hypothetical protein